jgi:hypothetical protein
MACFDDAARVGGDAISVVGHSRAPAINCCANLPTATSIVRTAWLAFSIASSTV